jgi:trehalose 6-phosphate synthase
MNRLVVVSNRVPLPSAGESAGGLAVALGGLMARRGGLWFGWSGDVRDDADTAPIHTEQADLVSYATIDLTPDEYTGYYNNFSNSVLWPLLHTLPELMHFDRADALTYRAVNARMAERLCPLLAGSDLVWIHDYHLLPLAAELRARGVRNPIGFFLHIPFASADVLAAAPEMAALVRDMLAADLLGFQTSGDLEHFAHAAQDIAGAVRLPGNALQVGARRVRLGVFPVEIDAAAFAASAAESGAGRPAERLRASLGGTALILGIDRMDPTKGLMQRLAGFRALLESRPEWREKATLLQIAAGSRKEVDSYRALRAALEAEAGALNAELGTPDWTPLRLLTSPVPREAGAGFMRAASVGLVTPVRDGMNLVAKEFIAAQDPLDPGVLILSHFAGAARQLSAALLVNPHDADAMADALDTALRMKLAERQERWRACWSALEGRSPIGWGRGFVAALLRARTSSVEARGLGGSYETASPAFADRPDFAAGTRRPGGLVAVAQMPPDLDPRLDRPALARSHRGLLN